MMTLHTEINLDIKGLLRWWRESLIQMLPPAWESFLRDSSGTALITADQDSYKLAFYPLSAELPEFELFLDAVNTDQLRSNHPELSRAVLLFRLDQDQALRKTVYLPNVAEKYLEQLVSFELDRLTPFTPAQVYFAAIPVARAPHDHLQVELLLTPRAILDQHLQNLRLYDLRPDIVDFEPLHRFQEPGYHYNLLPAALRVRPSVAVRVRDYALSSLLGLLFMAVLVWPVYQEAADVEHLSEQLHSIQAQTRAVIADQRKISQLSAQTQQLIDSKKESPSLLKVINELSKKLNDETWLQQLQYKSQKLQVIGLSTDATSLIGGLEGSDYFWNVSFVSPVTPDRVTHKERFEINMFVNNAADSALSESLAPAAAEPIQPE